MKALIIQHELSTPPGSTLLWLEKNNFTYKIHFFNEGDLDHNTEYDALIICGGSPNVDQEDIYPWLVQEKAFIKSAIKREVPIVGLCLGGQLLAEALGGTVFKAPLWEVGWQKVSLLETNSEMYVFQYHGYQFTTPPNALKIAESTACHHQAYSLGNKILAFQFHPESTIEWVNECANDPELPAVDTYVQTREEILKGNHHQELMQKWYFEKLNLFLL